MIRKYFICITAIIVLLWFAISHLLKTRIIAEIVNQSSDNMIFSYSSVNIDGFPFNITIQFVEPKLVLIDSHKIHEFSLTQIHLHLNNFLTSGKILLPRKIQYQVTQDETIKQYHVVNAEVLVIDFLLNKSIYFMNTEKIWSKYLSEIKTNIEQLSFLSDAQKIITISDVNIAIHHTTKNTLEQFRIRFDSHYLQHQSNQILSSYHNTTDSAIALHNALDMQIDLTYESDLILASDDYAIDKKSQTMTSASNPNHVNKIHITNIALKLNDSFIGFNGSLTWLQDNIIKGKINCIMQKHSSIIASISPTYFTQIQHIIRNAYNRKMLRIASTAHANKSHFIPLQSSDDILSFDMTFPDQVITFNP